MKESLVHDAVNQPARLNALRALDLLDTPCEPAFDRLTRLASRMMRTPIALLSLVDHHRQFFKSFLGLPDRLAKHRETPLTHSFCKHVVASNSPFVVKNSLEHPDVRDNPVIKEMGVGSYLGVPLLSPGGFVIGSFCVVDHVPRDWTEQDLNDMKDFAATVMSEFSHRAQVAIRRRTEAVLRSEKKRLKNALDSAGLVDWEFLPAKGKLYGSRRLGELLGLANDQVPQGISDWLTHVAPRDAEALADQLMSLISQKTFKSNDSNEEPRPGDLFSRVIEVAPPDRPSRTVIITGKLSRDTFGRPESINGVCQEVTRSSMDANEARGIHRLHRAGEGAGHSASEERRRSSRRCI